MTLAAMTCRHFPIATRKELCLRRGRTIDVSRDGHLARTRRTSNVCPRDIGAQVLAADHSGCGVFDYGAVLSRHSSPLALPLADSCPGYPQKVSESLLRTEHFSGRIDGVFHVHS